MLFRNLNMPKTKWGGAEELTIINFYTIYNRQIRITYSHSYIVKLLALVFIVICIGLYRPEYLLFE